MKFEIRRATSGQFFWRIVASNGQVLAASETYLAKASAVSAVTSVKANAGTAPTYDYAS